MSGLAGELHVGLKEWTAVCSALDDGRQILLLRKGGIHELAGKFELEHSQFVFFPTYLHQDPAMVKPAEQGRVQRLAAEPSRVELSLAGEVTDIVRLQSRAQMHALDDQHIWTTRLIDMRYNYRPQNPLYLMLVRAYRLRTLVTVENTPEYAGCKSWVPFSQSVATVGAEAVLNDDGYAAVRADILGRLTA